MSIESVKQEVQALVNAKFGANASMLWNVYNSSPGSDTIEYWENMRQALSAPPAAVQEAGTQEASSPSPAASEKQSGDWLYEADSGGIVITGFKGSGDELNIPAEIDGKAVVRIGKCAFEKTSFSVVTIPEGVTEICQEAFYSMEFLRHVDIPDSVVTIGDEAFQRCGLKSVRLEKGSVKTIGKDAFRNNNIEELTLPGGLETIGDNAFSKNKIKSLQIPDSVNSIGVEAFSGNDMENLILGLGLTVIGPKTFRNNKIKTIIIPDTVKEVCEEAFWQNNIEYAVIPDAGLTIGEKAFGKVKPIKVSEYNAKVASGKIIPPEQKPAPKSSSNMPGGNVTASDADGFPIRVNRLVGMQYLSPVIDLSDNNPPPYGRGWVFENDVYTILDYANVTIKGSNKGSRRRIMVGNKFDTKARKVNLTLDNVTLEIIDERKSSGDTPLHFFAPVTLWLKGENSVSKIINDEMYTFGFSTSTALKSNLELNIVGSGSLNITGSMDTHQLTIYGVKINVYHGRINCTEGQSEHNILTINGAEIFMGSAKERTEITDNVITGNPTSGLNRETWENGMRAKEFVLNGGSVWVESESNTSVEAEIITVNGGTLTAINNERKRPGGERGGSALGHWKNSVININGGKVTAIVHPKSEGAAIGTYGREKSTATAVTEEYYMQKIMGMENYVAPKLIMTGGVVYASSLEATSYDAKAKPFPLRTDTTGVTGGILHEGKKCIFKGEVKKDPDVPEFVPEFYVPTIELPGYEVIDGFEMMRVKAGTFIIGNNDEREDEKVGKPAHQVTLTKGFLIGVYPVTQKEWVNIMGSNPAVYTADSLNPVECVSYKNVMDFIAKLNEKTGKNFRLPTEAEWEFAARGGLNSQGFTFSGSNDFKEVGWRPSGATKYTDQVGVREYNELGIYDMSGNVWEWCSDWESDYTSDPKTDPSGPAEGSQRIIRGGSYDRFENQCSVYYRQAQKEDYKGNDLGFRLALGGS